MAYQRTRIKICGVQTPQDIQAAINAGADAVGFVFAENSPRKIDPALAGELCRLLPPFVEPVGLFVNAPWKQIMQITTKIGLRMVQLHGDEDTKFVINLAKDFAVFKAIKFGPGSVNNWINNPYIQMLIIDGSTGGKGITFDWSQLAELTQYKPDNSSRPIMLAGGLNADNVGRAIEIVKPYAVDVSSGVESSPGKKDSALIYEFCNAVRAVDLRINSVNNVNK